LGNINKQNILQRIKQSARRTLDRARKAWTSEWLSIMPKSMRYAYEEAGMCKSLPARVLYRQVEGGRWYCAIMLRKDALDRPILLRNGCREKWAHPRALVRPAGLYPIRGL